MAAVVPAKGMKGESPAVALVAIEVTFQAGMAIDLRVVMPGLDHQSAGAVAIEAELTVTVVTAVVEVSEGVATTKPVGPSGVTTTEESGVMVATLQTAMVVEAVSGLVIPVAHASGELRIGLQHKGWSSRGAPEVEEGAAEGARAAVAEAVAEAVGGISDELETVKKAAELVDGAIAAVAAAAAEVVIEAVAAAVTMAGAEAVPVAVVVGVAEEMETAMASAEMVDGVVKGEAEAGAVMVRQAPMARDTAAAGAIAAVAEAVAEAVVGVTVAMETVRAAAEVANWAVKEAAEVVAAAMAEAAAVVVADGVAVTRWSQGEARSRSRVGRRRRRLEN